MFGIGFGRGLSRATKFGGRGKIKLRDLEIGCRGCLWGKLWVNFIGVHVEVSFSRSCSQMGGLHSSGQATERSHNDSSMQDASPQWLKFRSLVKHLILEASSGPCFRSVFILQLRSWKQFQRRSPIILCGLKFSLLLVSSGFVVQHHISSNV